MSYCSRRPLSKMDFRFFSDAVIFGTQMSLVCNLSFLRVDVVSQDCWCQGGKTQLEQSAVKKSWKSARQKVQPRLNGLFIYICFDVAAVAAAALLVLGDLLHIWIYTVQYVNWCPWVGHTLTLVETSLTFEATPHDQVDEEVDHSKFLRSSEAVVIEWWSSCTGSGR